MDVGGVRRYVRGLKRYKKPIWLTEFACPAGSQYNSSLADVQNFMRQAVRLLDKSDAVERCTVSLSRALPIPFVSLLFSLAHGNFSWGRKGGKHMQCGLDANYVSSVR